MHLLVRESHLLDEADVAVDLAQTPADLLFLSFSDSDLGAAAAAWTAMERRPTLRLANLTQLRHPMSVDLYLDRVAAQARCIVVRLLGGLEYWRYGAEELSALCRDRSISLALLAGDERDDPALAELGTIEPAQRSRLDAYLRQGGPANFASALNYAAHLASLADDDEAPAQTVAAHGALQTMPHDADRRAVIVFYRSYFLAGDMAPIAALTDALHARGLVVATIYVDSLKNPDSALYVASRLREWRPHVVLNATAFAAGHASGVSPLAFDAPVLQVVCAGSSRQAWSGSPRGLAATDLAMHVVLPELDGNLLTGAISFKDSQVAEADLQFARMMHVADPDGVALAADRAAGWARLAATPRGDRDLAIVLSDYPGGGQRGHAVGLDSFASLSSILLLLGEAGFQIGVPPATGMDLREAPPSGFMSVETYRGLLAELPHALRERIDAAWGDPAADPAVQDGCFHAVHARHGRVVVALQPDRGSRASRKAGYHDPDLPPRHAFVAFYLWLRCVRGVHAMVHLGAHGTLEWLPGKSAALSQSCAPRALIGGIPVIYPFIVNNPGEAAAAKRRLGAVMIGHMTPPLHTAGLSGAAAAVERLLDEFAAADGLDRRRSVALRAKILAAADDAGLLAESGVAADMDDDSALARLDAYLCDTKDLQIRDGLHVFGRAPAPQQRERLLAALRKSCPETSKGDLASRLDSCAAAERAGLLAALDGKFVPSGPAGAPTRGRADVLPTGRNLFTVDPRAIPQRSACALAEAQCSELLRRHLQEHGDWPRRIVVDLWGSATMRTGGEDFALALLLMGVRPGWDASSGRVIGFEIEPLAVLDRPRVDVTLRVSGLFRDAFEAQIRLFDNAARAVAARDEAPEWNPLAAADAFVARVYGPAPGCYGSGVERMVADAAWQERADLGAAYLDAGGFAYGQDGGVPDRDGFAARIGAADALLHTQDHAETDVLDGFDVAGHVGGFAAAAASLGNAPILYHADTSDPAAMRIRTVAQQVARVVRGRAANPTWIAGMMRHGYGGAAEIARTVDALAGFAATLPESFDRQFDLIFDATLGDESIDAFLQANNPAARAAMIARFHEMRRRGLWHPRRNFVAEDA